MKSTEEKSNDLIRNRILDLPAYSMVLLREEARKSPTPKPLRTVFTDYRRVFRIEHLRDCPSEYGAQRISYISDPKIGVI
jgi:hypothetical protein